MTLKPVQHVLHRLSRQSCYMYHSCGFEVEVLKESVAGFRGAGMGNFNSPCSSAWAGDSVLRVSYWLGDRAVISVLYCLGHAGRRALRLGKGTVIPAFYCLGKGTVNSASYCLGKETVRPSHRQLPPPRGVNSIFYCSDQGIQCWGLIAGKYTGNQLRYISYPYFSH